MVPEIRTSDGPDELHCTLVGGRVKERRGRLHFTRRYKLTNTLNEVLDGVILLLLALEDL